MYIDMKIDSLLIWELLVDYRIRDNRDYCNLYTVFIYETKIHK